MINILMVTSDQKALDLAREALAENDSSLQLQFIPAKDWSLALFLANKHFPDLILCEIKSSNLFAKAQLDTQATKLAKTLGATKLFQLPSNSNALYQELKPYLKKHGFSRPSQTTE